MLVGIGWFDPVQWAKLKAIAADREHLHDTYEAWERIAEDALQQLSAGGVDVRRTPIDVDALAQWCRSNNMPIDGQARGQYTTLIVQGVISPRG